MLKKLFFCLLTIAFGLSFSTNSVAALEPGDIVMSVTPSEQDLELKPGETYEGSVNVTNIGRLPFDVNVSVSPFRVANDDYTPDYVTETSYTRLSNWIKLAQDRYHLEPGEKAVVEFTVDVPEGLAGSGQYAAIMLQSDSGISDESAVNINTRIAAVLYGHIEGGEVRTEGELVEHSLPTFMFNKDFSISQTVRNTGNTDFKVAQKLTVTNFFTGEEIIHPDSVSETGETLGYSMYTVLPGTTRTGILTWRDAPQLGLFWVTQQIDFLDQALTFRQLVFICPTWLLVLLIAFIIALIVMIIFRLTHKKRTADLPPDVL